MIAIIDYGMGNTGSIKNMFRKLGVNTRIAREHAEISNASAIVLPGVGAFDNGMEKLKRLGMTDLLSHLVLQEKRPFLGICLGMQMLMESSEEGSGEGLSWIRGRSRRFDFSFLNNPNNLKIPHMGWNVVHPRNNHADFFSKMISQPRYYFVHSYHVVCEDESDIMATANHGYEFTCAVRRNNIVGVQFHPEKSHSYGLAFFRNFLESMQC